MPLKETLCTENPELPEPCDPQPPDVLELIDGVTTVAVLSSRSIYNNGELEPL